MKSNKGVVYVLLDLSFCRVYLGLVERQFNIYLKHTRCNLECCFDLDGTQGETIMNKYRAHAVRRISFSDLKKIPHFFKWPSVKLLSRETDEALVPFLHDLGTRY